MVWLTKSKLFSLIAACGPVAALAVVAFLVTFILRPAGSHAFEPADYQLFLRPQAYYVGNTEVDLAFRVLGLGSIQ